ncbi:MAG: sucrose-specific PTS transporter subunit IIBC [Erysipelotrichaceae bacterium]|nr:sucrose-specific PTS transporter subunit IIBC [Erysipelotrichaceae bacterium]MDD3809028.1 sucrose-specific PTS transporter subunit IIBC [Erysipelotrichaceae bacterium]
MNYNAIAKEIIAGVGGKENIQQIFHCATRLRIVVKDSAKIDDAKVTDIEAVKGTFNNKGQYQIILGSGVVNLVCEQAQKITGIGGNDTVVNADERPEGNLLQRFVNTLSDIFVPIIPAIVAGGLLMGINNLLTSQGLFYPGMSVIDANPGLGDIAGFINMCANAPFVFLPVLIGFSATRKFGGNAFLGAALGMLMVHPDLLNAYTYGATGVEVPTWNLLGLAVEAVGYQGTVLPVLASSWILANIEKRLHKVTPIWLDNLSTPLLSILVTGLLTFIVVGPVMRIAGTGLAAGMTWIYDSLGFVGGGILGFFYAPLVITGMHHSFIAIETTLLADIANTGGTFIFPTASASNVAQGAAVLAVLLLTKDAKLKSICSASGVSALLGITEPAMFGVTLKLKYPFIGSCIGAAAGSAFMAATKTKAIALGAAGLPGFISFPVDSQIPFWIGIAIAFAVSFGTTFVLHKRNEMKLAKEKAAANTDVANGNLVNSTIELPIAGKVLPMGQSSDPVFSNKTLGDGFVVIPEDGNLTAPINGKISFIYPTKHAIGLVDDNGLEILIHVGIDTVSLEGRPFESFVATNDVVTAGQPLMKIDLQAIKAAGLSDEVIVIVTSKTSFKTKSEIEGVLNETILELSDA